MFDFFAWSLPVGRLFGIRIRIHIAYPLVAIPLVARVALREGAPPGTWIDASIVFILIAGFLILAHEIGHALAARYVGGESDEVMLWPLGGLARASFLP